MFLLTGNERKNGHYWNDVLKKGQVSTCFLENIQETFTCSCSTIETLDKSVKYVWN